MPRVLITCRVCVIGCSRSAFLFSSSCSLWRSFIARLLQLGRATGHAAFVWPAVYSTTSANTTWRPAVFVTCRSGTSTPMWQMLVQSFTRKVTSDERTTKVLRCAGRDRWSWLHLFYAVVLESYSAWYARSSASPVGHRSPWIFLVYEVYVPSARGAGPNVCPGWTII